MGAGEAEPGLGSRDARVGGEAGGERSWWVGGLRAGTPVLHNAVCFLKGRLPV